jgi:hypothetical protein
LLGAHANDTLRNAPKNSFTKKIFGSSYTLRNEPKNGLSEKKIILIQERLFFIHKQTQQ